MRLDPVHANDNSHLAALTAALRTNGDPTQRAKAAFLLGSMRDPRATKVLLEALFDEQWAVRSNAGWALVELGDRSLPFAHQILTDYPHTPAAEMAEMVCARLKYGLGGWLQEL